MNTKNSLKIILAVNCILASITLAKNNNQMLNILAVVFPPFIIADTNHNSVRGIDAKILKIVANQLDLRLNWFTTNNTRKLSTTELE